MYVVVFDNLDPILTIGLPVYALLLTSMVWRSVVQAHTTPNFLNILCAFGSFMFAISDGFIAIDKFYLPIPHARVGSGLDYRAFIKFSLLSLQYYIMSTYYFAQCAIALSVLNRIEDVCEKKIKKKPKKK